MLRLLLIFMTLFALWLAMSGIYDSPLIIALGRRVLRNLRVGSSTGSAWYFPQHLSAGLVHWRRSAISFG